jgi:hypothetical protein
MHYSLFILQDPKGGMQIPTMAFNTSSFESATVPDISCVRKRIQRGPIIWYITCWYFLPSQNASPHPHFQWTSRACWRHDFGGRIRGSAPIEYHPDRRTWWSAYMVNALGRCKRLVAFRATMSPTPVVALGPTVISNALVVVERPVAILTPVRHIGVNAAGRWARPSLERPDINSARRPRGRVN